MSSPELKENPPEESEPTNEKPAPLPGLIQTPKAVSPFPTPIPKGKKQKQMKGSTNILSYGARKKKVEQLKRDAEDEVRAEDWGFLGKVMGGLFILLLGASFTSEFRSYQSDYPAFYIVTVLLLIFFIVNRSYWFHSWKFDPREKRVWDKTDKRFRVIDDTRTNMNTDQQNDLMKEVFGDDGYFGQ